MVDVYNNGYEYKGYFIYYDTDMYNIIDMETDSIIQRTSTEKDAEEFIDIELSDNIATKNKNYVVYKKWRSGPGLYTYSFYKGGKASNNVRYSEDSIVKGSQKDVTLWTKSDAENECNRLNLISRRNNYTPSWKYSKKWW